MSRLLRLGTAAALVFALLTVACACSSTTLDPTELTTDVYIANHLGVTILLQTCSTNYCTQHTGGHVVTPGESSYEIVEDTSRNPFRVVTRSDSRLLGCFAVGPKVSQGERVSLTHATLRPCSQVRGG